jgi:hypothetical protein
MPSNVNPGKERYKPYDHAAAAERRANWFGRERDDEDQQGCRGTASNPISLRWNK